MYYYFPSCKFTAANPEVSRRLKKYLSAKPDIQVTGCCRVNQEQLTEEDTAVTICLSCAAITGEVSPETREISIWEYLLEDPEFPWPDYHGESMVIQDCWRARNLQTLQQAVRDCMERMNICLVELEENREATQFDGVWRFNPVQQGNLDIAPNYFGAVRDSGVILLPPEEQKQKMEEWCRQYTTERVVTYCNACLAGVRQGGVEGVHLMELMAERLPE